VGIDISFPGVQHVFGIPEHATDHSLPATKVCFGRSFFPLPQSHATLMHNHKTQALNTDPYRLYNLDVFEYELDNPMALYGSIPFMVAHRAAQTTGVLFLNSAEMWVDIDKVWSLFAYVV
jgi:alpha 1,3-glucosidase